MKHKPKKAKTITLKRFRKLEQRVERLEMLKLEQVQLNKFLFKAGNLQSRFFSALLLGMGIRSATFTHVFDQELENTEASFSQDSELLETLIFKNLMKEIMPQAQNPDTEWLKKVLK